MILDEHTEIMSVLFNESARFEEETYRAESCGSLQNHAGHGEGSNVLLLRSLRCN
jgi:hypothetical protein